MKVWKKGDKDIPKGAVYVGRPSKFGNPFVMQSELHRDEVCDRFANWFFANEELVQAAKRELKGKDLVCFCAPKRCHADLLMQIANQE